MNPQQTKRLEEIEVHTPSYTAVTRKAYSGKSRSAAIKAKCLDCSCWQRTEITLCTVTTCPLWPYRPYQAGNEINQDAIP